MRVENKVRHLGKFNMPIDNRTREETEDVGSDQKKPIKRKLSSANTKRVSETIKIEAEASSSHLNAEQDDDLWGTIANENDSSDEDCEDDEADTVSEDDGQENATIEESDKEGDDNGNELSDYESEDESDSENDTTNGVGKFTSAFYKMTSLTSARDAYVNKSDDESEDESEDELNDQSRGVVVNKANKSVVNKSSDVRVKKPSKTNIDKSNIMKSNIFPSGSDEKSDYVEVPKKVGPSKQVKEKMPDSDGQYVKPDPENVFPNEEVGIEGEGAVKSLLDKVRKEMAESTDEYETDTSDEEDIRNTVGNIPMKWYDDQPHLGYDWEGKKILKPPSGDELDNFLRKMEDPNFWRTVKDPQTGQDVVLCDADADLIARLQKHKIPDPDFKEYAPWIEWFSSEVMQMPLRKIPDSKQSFLPSKDEARIVSRMVHAIKMGWIKPKQEKSKEPQFYMLWESDDTAEHMRRIHDHIPAPKRHLPIHAESYNPPPEYLFDNIEKREWKNLKKTPWKRKLHFVPKKYASLREVPYYDNYIKERFLRCLDLYLCPRARKMRLLIQPEDLVPQLPSPKDLQPFPTTLALVYKGHTDMVRSITVEPKGQYLASGSDDLTVKIWEVATGRCVKTIPAGGVVRSVSWCPNTALSLLAVAADRKLLLINPGVGDFFVVKKTDNLLEEAPEQDVLVPERVKGAVQWEQAAGEEWRKGIRIIINHFKEIKQVTWHGRGDYFATVMPEAQNRSVVIHQVSKRRSQIPFNRSKGLVQCVLFHPIRPIFFVATQKNVRVYDLVKQEIVKKLLSNAKWISTMAVHPGGDNLLVGTYDRKILWFDLDLSTKPYQTLRLHGYAVRGVAYHKRYPLFASGSDDNSVIVSHGMVYNDLLQNPLIVPVKRMSYHEKQNDFSVFEVLFHPSQPWLFSSGADGTVRLYT